MPLSPEDVFTSAMETARSCYNDMRRARDKALARVATLEGEADMPVVIDATPEPEDQDRKALNAWLDQAGYRRTGDLVYLTPVAPSVTRAMMRSEKAVTVNIVTESREQLTFMPKGYCVARFRKNPVVLYNHDYEGLPVARSLWERVRDGDHGPELVAKPQFHMDTELSREVWGLVMSGNLSAWELSVIPETWEPNGAGYYVTEWSVLEYSVVPRLEDLEQLGEEYKAGRITSPALVKSIFTEEAPSD